MSWDDNCFGCEALDRALHRECNQYEKELDVLRTQLTEVQTERDLLLEQVEQLRFRIEGLEK